MLSADFQLQQQQQNMAWVRLCLPSCKCADVSLEHIPAHEGACALRLLFSHSPRCSRHQANNAASHELRLAQMYNNSGMNYKIGGTTYTGSGINY